MSGERDITKKKPFYIDNLFNQLKGRICNNQWARRRFCDDYFVFRFFLCLGFFFFFFNIKFSMRFLWFVASIFVFDISICRFSKDYWICLKWLPTTTPIAPFPTVSIRERNKKQLMIMQILVAIKNIRNTGKCTHWLMGYITDKKNDDDDDERTVCWRRRRVKINIYLNFKVFKWVLIL